MYQWLPINPFNLIFCVISGAVWLAGGINTAFTSEKIRQVGAVSLIFGASSYLLLALSALWMEQVEILSQISGFAWGPALACLAWSGLGIWPGLDRYKSLSFIPVVALLLYLFRLLITPVGAAEALAIYAPLMSLPLVSAAIRSKARGKIMLAIGSAGVGIALGGPFWLNMLLPESGNVSCWLGWLTIPSAFFLTFGWLRYNIDSSEVGSSLEQG